MGYVFGYIIIGLIVVGVLVISGQMDEDIEYAINKAYKTTKTMLPKKLVYALIFASFVFLIWIWPIRLITDLIGFIGRTRY